MAKQVASLPEVLADQLKDLYSAETQITKALPKMAAAATAPDLKKGFLKHLEQTKVHAERLKAVCTELNITPTGKKCMATAGLVEEGQEAIDENATPEMKDVMLIGSAQRVEHYEMAGYTAAMAIAKALGLKSVLKTLSSTLSEEVATDALLMKMGTTLIAKAGNA